jgi:uncharacterized protein (TIGR02284 family)
MATLVGTQKVLSSMLNQLIELDYDTIEAYRAAMDRLASPNDRTQLQWFLADHERHVRELSILVRQLGETPAEQADMKQVLTKGKVVIASLLGDRAVLSAMKSNEDDTNTAYERAVRRNDLPAKMRSVLERNLADERRHRAWFEARIADETHATV